MALGSDTPGLQSQMSPASCVPAPRLLNYSLPRFPHLQSGANSPCISRLLMCLVCLWLGHSGTGIGWSGLHSCRPRPPRLQPNLKLLPAWPTVPSADTVSQAAACLPMSLVLLPPLTTCPSPVYSSCWSLSLGSAQLPSSHVWVVSAAQGFTAARLPAALTALPAPLHPVCSTRRALPGFGFHMHRTRLWRHDLATRFQPAEQETDAQCHGSAERAGSCPRWVSVPSTGLGL